MHLLVRFFRLCEGIAVIQESLGLRGKAADGTLCLELVDQSANLNRNNRRESHEGNAAECLGHDIAAERRAGADCHGEHEGAHHHAAGNSTRVECDTCEEARNEEGKTECDHVAGNEDPEDRDTGEDAEHRESERRRNTDRKSRAHGARRDCTRSDLLNLLVEHVNGRLGIYDEEADEHTDGHEQPSAALCRELLTNRGACGKKALVCTREEDYQTDKGVNDTHADTDQSLETERTGDKLKEHGEGESGKQCNGNVLGVIGKAVGHWIYLVDAADDFLQDRKKKRFNPYLRIFDNAPSDEQIEALRTALTALLSDAERGILLLDEHPSPELKAILFNILYLGLPKAAKRATAAMRPEQEGVAEKA